MIDDPPRATPHDFPATEAATKTIGTAPPQARGFASTKRRPVRGVISRGRAVGEIMIGEKLSDDAYISPLFPDGLTGKELSASPSVYQAAAVLHWFWINFEPLGKVDQLVFSDGTRGFFSDGSPISFSSPPTSADSTSVKADSAEFRVSAEDGSGLATEEGRPLFLELAPDAPLLELRSEFGDLIADDLLQQLDDGLLARSPLWQFIPFPDPLPIELDGVGRLQSEVDATRVRRDVDELEAHLAAPTNAAKAHGQNYWPGAELLDDGLRRQTEEVSETLREAASAAVTPIEPVKRSVGRLVGLRKQVGQWIAEGAVRGLAADAAKWGVSSAPLWWHWLYHLLSQLLADTQAWLLSLLEG